MSDDDRPTSILTGRQRDVLNGVSDADDRGKRASRSRSRKRVYHGLLDGSILWARMPAKDRARIFEMWESQADDEQGGVARLEARSKARQEFAHALTNFLAFLYAGISESNSFGVSFKDLLETAVYQAVHARGEVIEEYDFTVETSEEYELSDLMKRFIEADPTLSQMEMEYLYTNADLSGEAFERYYQMLHEEFGQEDTVHQQEPSDHLRQRLNALNDTTTEEEE